MTSKKTVHFHISNTLLTGILIANILCLDVWMAIHFLWGNPTVLGTTSDGSCPQACIDRINQTTGSKYSSKEYFVPLGSGSGSSTEWADVSGAQAYIDSTLYPAKKTVTFEVTLGIPTGNQKAWARLYNATDKHPVLFSEMSMEGSEPQALVSSPITFDTGKKLYIVQLKTQLGVLTNILQSRIHIVAK
jgi:hypothetical protein